MRALSTEHATMVTTWRVRTHRDYAPLPAGMLAARRGFDVAKLRVPGRYAVLRYQLPVLVALRPTTYDLRDR
jgi:hypothetical protein